MAIKYSYNFAQYDTEAEAQAAVVALKTRLENNPSDWMRVKEISGSNETGWEMPPDILTDDQINNLDSSKMYSVFCMATGENLMPLTASEVNTKKMEYRAAYANWCNANDIFRFDDSVLPSQLVRIDTDEDMSIYL